MNFSIYRYFFFFLLNFNLLVASNPDSTQVISLCEKAHSFEQSNADSALFYATEAYNLAKEINNSYLLAAAALQQGAAYYNMGDYKRAAQLYKEGITHAEKCKDLKLQAQAYNGFANLFAQQKQHEQATEYFNKALVISKELKDTRKVAVILMNMANIEYNKAYYSNDFTKTNKAYSKAYEWSLIAKDTSQMITCLGNWGMSYSDETKFDLSLDKLNKAIELAVISHNNADLVFLKYYIGRTYSIMDKNEKALEAFNESLKLALEFKDVDFQAENYICMAESNYALGNYKIAYDYFKQYKNTEDTISSKELAAELNTIKGQYDTEKKQKEIEILKVNANKDKIVKMSLLAGAVLLLVLAFLMFNRYRLKAKTNKLLEHQNEIISEKNKDISDSINYAKKIQEAILPDHSEIKKVFPDHFILSMPKDVVSGDFYWFTQHDQYKLFVVADCTGHGVPGAFMSMIGNTLLSNIVIERKIIKPDLILNELRREIIKSLKQGEGSQSKDGMDLSLICFNTQTHELQIAGANNPVWIMKNDGSMLEIKADKQPIGYVSEESKDFAMQLIVLERGDIIYQFTDGYADQFGGEKGKKFKYNQLRELLLANKSASLEMQAVILKQNFEDWKGKLMQVDDVLVTGIRV